jgi:inhibitor of cysteine peptidase
MITEKALVWKMERFSPSVSRNLATGTSWQLNLNQGLGILSDNYIQDEVPEGYESVSGNHTWMDY